ncbi:MULTISPECIES: MFS transporter [Mycobacterium]|nr:MFS transporter [Mycobacterium pseudoshottsii]EPQ46639.1 Multidrug resistance protein B [Mycobacterium sp. 012931]MBC9863300.1 Multidrug resistance protein ErmB [Mycobacterium pseudoshottsii]BEH77979.1 MFS transporter [Mycobacterium pseudoshottsii]
MIGASLVAGRARRIARGTRRARSLNPWPALWAMLVGYFMIVLDSTVVMIANPSIMADQHTSYYLVIWVTSAYLLTYAAPLLVAGRLGDRFGPKNIYVIGLAVFTAASLWCGLSGSIGMLITARAVQGLGASLLFPQTLSIISRIFEPQRRGVALAIWTATGGVVTLVGPLAGGVLVQALGWQWIFFINVPIGLAGLVLAALLLPVLPVHRPQLDLLGAALSALGVFLVVFALQEGQHAGWAPWTSMMLIGGVGVIAVFVYWQSVNRGDPLVPLKIFSDRNFSLSSIGVAAVAFATTAMMVPAMFFVQSAVGLSPIRSAALIAPMVVMSGVVSPLVGKIVDRYHPKLVVSSAFTMLAVALTWLSIEMSLSTPIWRLVLPITALGVAIPFVWAPLAAIGSRDLPAQLAGTGAGVYTAARQVGAVLGASGMAAFMTARIAAEMPPSPGNSPALRGSDGTAVRLPGLLREPFSVAMSQSMLLPACVALCGVAAGLFMLGFSGSTDTGHEAADQPG